MNQGTQHLIPNNGIVDSDFRPRIEREDEEAFNPVDIYSADFRPKIVVEEDEFSVPKDVTVLESAELAESLPLPEGAKTEPEGTPQAAQPNALSLAARVKPQSTEKTQSENS